MSAPGPAGRGVIAAINRVALIVSLALLVAIAGLWTREQMRPHETPRWPAAHAVALRAADAGARERWIVTVNPECAHCRERLAGLAGSLARDGASPALGVLLVDVPHRPDSLAGADALAGGVWWDSAATWRSRWGRHRYGEVLVFAPDGALRRIVPPDSAVASR